MAEDRRRDTRVLRGPPPEHEVPPRLGLEDVETIGRARNGREECADRNVLELLDDSGGTSPTTVVDDVVAVPARTIAGSHLCEPRPDLTRWSPNRDRVGQR